ncbi:AraC family transcriptional regulator [Pseudomonas sp. NPDC088368]|uniref:AraC family transcriptional regulator n=1 Tax=Pseudomonas sp. NPDC088368 TaxID=3364453 RepID=UPI0038016C00
MPHDKSLKHHFVAPGVILMQARISGDWGVDLPFNNGAYFHFVLEGHAYVFSDTFQPIKLQSGDIMVVSQGAPHKVVHGPDSLTMPVEQFLAELNGTISKANDATAIVCGFFDLEAANLLSTLKSLPPYVHLEACNSLPISENLNQLREELRRKEFGTQQMIRHLLSTIFIYILREWENIRSAPAETLVSISQRRQIAASLARIHEKPFEPWTLESLALSAGLSRSAFAKIFAMSVGQTPYAYLTRFRMGLATQMLKDTDESISRIATRVGYSSQYSFSKAFKQIRGVSPGQVRAHPLRSGDHAMSQRLPSNRLNGESG